MAGQVVIFTLEEEEYALPIEIIQEIIRADGITPIPEAPDYVLGSMDVRGQAIPVIDLRSRFGLPPAKVGMPETENFALIANIQGNTVGLMVDQVREVRMLKEVLPPPVLVTVPFIGGVANFDGRIVMQLVSESLLSDEEWQGLSNMTQGAWV